MEEIWKDIEGYNGIYQVSSFGRIKSLRYDRVMSTKKTDKDGYKILELQVNAKRRYVKVHRVVAMAFIPNPNNYPMVNHKDADKANNIVSNLEWCTKSHNVLHAARLGLINCSYGEKHFRAKLTREAVLDIRKREISQKAYAAKYGVSNSCVAQVQLGKNWTKESMMI